jgi:PLP dependent protein
MKKEDFLIRIPYDTFADRARRLENRIREICAASGRSPGDVKLMAVTKTHPAEAAGYAARYGLPCVGENRVREAIDKIARAGCHMRWELIGHLQSNKAALAVRHFARIQSVDRPKLVARLQRCCESEDRTLPVLLQVNTGNDAEKFGATAEEAPVLLEAALNASRLKVEGLMTIAPFDPDPSVARRAFASLRELRDRLQDRFATPLPELSMGMTGDLREAIEEGSTCVRVGSALFGPRE